MYNTFQLAKKYLRYYASASNSKGHGMHSPFVFSFILNVLNNGSGFHEPAQVERLRKILLEDDRTITINDLGAGSRTRPTDSKKICEIARSALKSKRLALVLFRLAKFYKPATIIELGTSLGLTTSYFSKALPESNIITIEGSTEVAEVAKQNFFQLQCNNISLIKGNFDEVLPGVLEGLAAVDLAYIDGNHRYGPTINYFNQFLARSTEESILVFDDIHWSEEMERAWEEIKAHPAVQYTIDIFFLGFVFFRKEFRVKQNFTIRF